MTTAAAERREEMLGLLAEKALALACAVQQRALEAEGSNEMAHLAGAFHKLGRCVRQTVALQARFEGERLRGEPKPAPADRAPAPPKEPQALAVEQKAARVKRAVERCLWDEYDVEDNAEFDIAVSLEQDLDERLVEFARSAADFLAADPDDIVEGLCRELGLEPPPRRPRLTLATEPREGPEAERAGRLDGAPNTS